MTRLLKLIKLRNYPILKQLQLEEALLRAKTPANANANFMIINCHDPKNQHHYPHLREEQDDYPKHGTPAIIMGISGKPESLLNIENVKRDRIPIIKRFSGGGTVLVDHNTCYASFVCTREFLRADGVSNLYPRDIMQWTEPFYKKVFGSYHQHQHQHQHQHPTTSANAAVAEFSLRENDYVFGDKKIGGNAQCITGDRFVHHTSFLWDFDEKQMEQYLLLPSKRPEYRGSRSHSEFLSSIKKLLREHHNHEVHEDVAGFAERIEQAARAIDNLVVEDVTAEELWHITKAEHRRTNQLIPDLASYMLEQQEQQQQQ